jgi:hypothetical protein
MTCSPAVPALPTLAEPVGCCVIPFLWLGFGSPIIGIEADQVSWDYITGATTGLIEGLSLGSSTWLGQGEDGTTQAIQNGAATSLGSSPYPTMDVDAIISTINLRSTQRLPDGTFMSIRQARDYADNTNTVFYSTQGSLSQPFSWQKQLLPLSEGTAALMACYAATATKFLWLNGVGGTSLPFGGAGWQVGSIGAGMVCTELALIPKYEADGADYWFPVGAWNGFGNSTRCIFFDRMAKFLDPNGLRRIGMIQVFGGVVTSNFINPPIWLAIEAWGLANGIPTMENRIESLRTVTYLYDTSQWVVTVQTMSIVGVEVLWCVSGDDGATWTVSGGPASPEILFAGRDGSLLWNGRYKYTAPNTVVVTQPFYPTVNPANILPSDIAVGQRP